MKKICMLLAVFALILTAFPMNGALASTSANERVIVVFKDKANKNLVSQADGKVLHEYDHIPALSISVPSQAIRGLKNNPNVVSVEVDQKVQAKQTIDWGIERTNAPSSWETNLTGEGVKVAVIDTGIANHEDLTLAGGVSLVSYTDSFADDNGHGTHVAGIIGASNNSIGTVGIANGTSLYAVKSLDQNGSGYLSDIIAGVDWSITEGMDIVNLSLGAQTASTALELAVNEAYSQGVLVVAAAGNDGSRNGKGDSVDYPARYDSAIAVGATDINDSRAYFSSTGDTVEVAAPGNAIYSTYINNQYAQLSGTSMAAPYVAGNVALLIQAYPELTHQEIRVKLQEGVIDLGDQGRDPHFGFGLIQAPVAFSVEQGTTEETVTEEGTTDGGITEETTTEEPVNETEAVFHTITDVTTDKSIYTVGDNIIITVSVTDENGSAVSGADVSLFVEPPAGKSMEGFGTTNSDGKAAFVFSTNKGNKSGTYHVTADTYFEGLTPSAGDTTFQIK